MSENLFFVAIVFLLSAVVCVPIAKKIGLSSVIGYLVAGTLIGPYVFGLIGAQGEDIMHFAEFGVVMMLFLIGLEIDPKSFWKMRNSILGLGGAQVFGTMLLTFLILYYLGFQFEIALTISMAVSLSSTAITLQTIKEKGLFKTTYGASSFSILLFQDIMVIFMLGALPLLATNSPILADDESHFNLLKNLPLGLQALAILGSVVLIIFLGNYLVVPMLRKVSDTKVRELLTAAALLIVIGISFIMQLVGLSPALGAFLGGVVLANSEFKHELESSLEPFKGLLLGLFFMAVGASINFIVIKENPILITALVFGVIFLKAFVLIIVGFIFKLKIDQKLLLAIGLAQIGEFAFVLLSFAHQLNIFSQEQLDLLLVITALSMALTPVLALLNEKFILPKIGVKEEEKPDDQIEEACKVILVGFGHFGSTIGRILRANGIFTTVLDKDASRVELLRKMGLKVYYGDATRLDLLESAGIADAKLLICAIDDATSNLEIVKKVKEKYPNIKLMVRARNRYDASELLNIGVENVYREYLGTSVTLARHALQEMGFSDDVARQQAQKFIKYDETSLRRLSKDIKNEDEYVFRVRQEIKLQEKLLEGDRKRLLIEKRIHESE